MVVTHPLKQDEPWCSVPGTYSPFGSALTRYCWPLPVGARLQFVAG